MDPQNDISNWISGIPKITRYWFFAFFAIPLSTRLGLINPMYLILQAEPLFYKFQVPQDFPVIDMWSRCPPYDLTDSSYSTFQLMNTGIKAGINV